MREFRVYLVSNGLVNYKPKTLQSVDHSVYHAKTSVAKCEKHGELHDSPSRRLSNAYCLTVYNTVKFLFEIRNTCVTMSSLHKWCYVRLTLEYIERNGEL